MTRAAIRSTGTACRSRISAWSCRWTTGTPWPSGCAARGTFEIEPYVRFKGQVGEQATMFFRDPSGNAVEIKAFADIGQLFAR